MNSNGKAMQSEGRAGRGHSMQGKCYEVNCCAVALRSTDRQGEGKALMGLAVAVRGCEDLSLATAKWGGAENRIAIAWQRKALM